MTPAHPPFPTPANFPFQLSRGSQTSNRMSDSGVGLIVPATRQNGGRLFIAFVEPGGVNDPPVTVWTAVMDVFGNAPFARAVHAAARSLCACSAAARVAERTAAIRAVIRVFMMPPGLINIVRCHAAFVPRDHRRREKGGTQEKSQEPKKISFLLSPVFSRQDRSVGVNVVHM